MRYVSAFGVYQDYYTREFLSHETPSNIRCVDLTAFNFVLSHDFFCSWIGSFQLFMQYAPGIFVGRAFDAGYL